MVKQVLLTVLPAPIGSGPEAWKQLYLDLTALVPTFEELFVIARLMKVHCTTTWPRRSRGEFLGVELLSHSYAFKAQANNDLSNETRPWDGIFDGTHDTSHWTQTLGSFLAQQARHTHWSSMLWLLSLKISSHNFNASTAKCAACRWSSSIGFGFRAVFKQALVGQAVENAFYCFIHPVRNPPCLFTTVIILSSLARHLYSKVIWFRWLWNRKHY